MTGWLARWRALRRAGKAATHGPWYVTEDDLVGGWCVRTSPLPPSSGHGVSVADFMREADARLCAAARNLHLGRPAPRYLAEGETTDLAVDADGHLVLRHGVPGYIRRELQGGDDDD